MQRWSGREARALRRALRLSVRAFAEHLGIAVRTVSKWEAQGVDTHPRPDTQAILDTALARADPAARERFVLLSTETASVPSEDHVPVKSTRDDETWDEDIDRVIACLSRQDFQLASNLLNRWFARIEPGDLDSKGLYLYARSLMLLGDMRRDRGTVTGSRSARAPYQQACGVFAELNISRRVAQTELSLAVVAEMSGNLVAAARRYEGLAADERLSRRDRARARLWVGTALSKEGRNENTAQIMRPAAQEFEELGESEDWSVAHQKLALAYRGAGDLSRALEYIDVARSAGAVHSPMQRVRLDTAHAHVLLSDPATRDDGLAVLDHAAHQATQYELSHQLRSIEKIQRTCDGMISFRK